MNIRELIAHLQAVRQSDPQSAYGRAVKVEDEDGKRSDIYAVTTGSKYPNRTLYLHVDSDEEEA